jgi:prepilin-type N-terminal cleavage/methylation domain-containing protein
VRRHAGLTIIEVLVALVVVAISVAAVTPVMVGSMRANADSRAREQAITATNGWLDRFRAKTLDFSAFTSALTFDFGHDYASDDIFVAAGDPNAEVLNDEWSQNRYIVTTSSYSSDPQVWLVRVMTVYSGTGGGEAQYVTETLIAQ